MSGSPKTLKRCRDCGEDKPLGAFSPSTKSRDGRVSYCRPCLAERHKKYRRAKAASEGRQVRERRDVPDGHRWCPDCKTAKPLSDFPRNRSGRGGYGGYCRPCHSARGRATYIRLYGSTREYHLRRRYGIGQAEVDAMLAAQGGVCAACKTDEPKHVDHDHRTGRVRGMLCFLCNQALGNVRDDARRLHGLIDYLHRDRIAALGLTVTEVEHTDIIIELGSVRLHAA
jgi:hypothetical protein